MSPLGLESLFDTAFLSKPTEASFESFGPMYSAEDFQLSMEVAGEMTALECTMESLAILSRKGISMESGGVATFIAGIIISVGKFFLWIQMQIGKFFNWVKSLFAKKPSKEAVAKAEADGKTIHGNPKSEETYRESLKETRESIRRTEEDLHRFRETLNAGSKTYDFRDAETTLDDLLSAARQGKASQEKQVQGEVGHLVDTDEGEEIRITPQSVEKAYRSIEEIDKALKETTNYNDKIQKTLIDTLEQIKELANSKEITPEAASKLSHFAGQLTTAIKRAVKDVSPAEVHKLPSFKIIQAARAVQKSLDDSAKSA